MLCSLSIENMAVIKSCDISFSPGFTAFTGETGTGKSIIMDSISLLCGARADKSFIRTGEEKASVSGFFTDVSPLCVKLLENAGVECENGEILLQRSITSDGRSACRINGRQLPLTVFKEISETLINIHGQQDNWQLLRENSHCELLDKYAGNASALEDYRKAYRTYTEKKREFMHFLEQVQKDSEERDVLNYRMSELKGAKLKAGEEEKLLEKRKALQNAEKIEKQTSFVYRAIKGGEKVNVIYLLERSSAALSGLSEVSEQFSELAERIDNVKYELEDVADTAVNVVAASDGDPSALLTALESRLDKLDRLKKKFKRDTDGLISLLAETEERLSKLDNAEVEEDKIRDELNQAYNDAVNKALLLSQKRRNAASRLSDIISDELAFLDMPNVRFAVFCETAKSGEEYELMPEGIDTVRFMLAGAAGEPPRPLSKIASGGELSRVMLAIKSVFAEADGVGTVIFDEIDAGVSGKTARKIGIKLQNVSDTCQVLCVTHSAQIASLACSHMLVYKQLVGDMYSSSVKELKDEARINELSRILGGINVTEAQKKAASDLLINDKEL